MTDFITFLGKQVRYQYQKNGQKHAVSGHLKTVQEDRLKIGDMWLPITEKSQIQEIEFKGF